MAVTKSRRLGVRAVSSSAVISFISASLNRFSFLSKGLSCPSKIRVNVPVSSTFLAYNKFSITSHSNPWLRPLCSGRKGSTLSRCQLVSFRSISFNPSGRFGNIWASGWHRSQTRIMVAPAVSFRAPIFPRSPSSAPPRAVFAEGISTFPAIVACCGRQPIAFGAPYSRGRLTATLLSTRFQRPMTLIIRVSVPFRVARQVEDQAVTAAFRAQAAAHHLQVQSKARRWTGKDYTGGIRKGQTLLWLRLRLLGLSACDLKTVGSYGYAHPAECCQESRRHKCLHRLNTLTIFSACRLLTA